MALNCLATERRRAFTRVFTVEMNKVRDKGSFGSRLLEIFCMSMLVVKLISLLPLLRFPERCSTGNYNYRLELYGIAISTGFSFTNKFIIDVEHILRNSLSSAGSEGNLCLREIRVMEICQSRKVIYATEKFVGLAWHLAVV